MGFRDSGQRPDVLAIFVREFFELMDIAKRELKIHGQRLDTFVDGHGVSFSEYIGTRPVEKISFYSDP